MVENRLKGSTFWKACYTQNTWECWRCTGGNQQRSVTDSARTRSWSGDSKSYCVRDFDAGSWRETLYQNSSCSFCTRAEGTSCCSWQNCVRSQGAYVEGDWDVVVLLQCFLYLVSSSINVSSFHIMWLDTFWTDIVWYQVCTGNIVGNTL